MGTYGVVRGGTGNGYIWGNTGPRAQGNRVPGARVTRSRVPGTRSRVPVPDVGPRVRSGVRVPDDRFRSYPARQGAREPGLMTNIHCFPGPGLKNVCFPRGLYQVSN